MTQANGPRIIVNNEEERFSGDKHSTEYPRQSVDAMVATLRSIGRDVGDIAAFVTTWDYPTFFATLTRTVVEEAPASLRLLGVSNFAGIDKRRLVQIWRTPRFSAGNWDWKNRCH